MDAIRALKVPKRHPVSRWADENRILDSSVSSRPGRWKTATTPYLREIMDAFTDPEVEEIVVVTREDLVGPVAALAREMALTKVTKVVRGGATRVESAQLGVAEVSPQAKLIGIHDGARPFVSSQVMERVVDKAAQTGAAAPAIPVQDTIKVAVNGVVDHTPDRATLFAVQTPQIFDGDLIRGALTKAMQDNAPLTDDCSAVERLGMPVSLVEGDRSNIKLTTPADLAVARVILEGWNQ